MPSLDVFSNKPLYIDPACTGDINIYAYISELSSKMGDTKTSETTSISSYCVFNNLVITPGENTFEIDRQNISEFITDSDLNNFKFIPAFYDYGNIQLKYTVTDTADEYASFDVKFNVKIGILNELDWYKCPVSYDRQTMLNLIKSDSSEVSYPTVQSYTTMSNSFTISSWSGMPPIVIKDYVEYDSDGNAKPFVKRGCLEEPTFRLIITNNLTSNVTLNNVVVIFTFYYSNTGLLMNITPNPVKGTQYSNLYTYPKGADTDMLDSVDKSLFGIITGYKKAEMVKVYAFYNKWYSDFGCYYPSVIPMSAIEYYDPTDVSGVYPWSIWKSDYGIVNTDFDRIAYKGITSDDYVEVITPQIMASDSHHRDISVKVVDDGDINDVNAVISITTTPRTDIDDVITPEDLLTNIKTVKFYNCECPYDTTVTFKRSDIDPVFRETLYNTYQDSVVLQSILSEALNYIKFTINSYPAYIPIYDGGSVKFSDSLEHCVDGVRSGDIFYFDNNIPNVINITNDSQYKYKVKFKIDYDIYKNVWIHEYSE